MASSSSSSSSPSVSTSSSSSSPSSSSSSTPSSPCGGKQCQWEITPEGPVAVIGCGDGCHCPEPINVRGPTPGDPTSISAPSGSDTVPTDCFPNFPIPGPSSSSSSGIETFGIAALARAAVTSEEVLIRVPDETNGGFPGFSVQVTNGFKIFRGVGWVVTMTRLASPTTNAFVVPETIPAPAPSAGGVIALITLPEADGPVQYWVPVLELHLGAVLQSREWIVAFNKRAKPATP